MVPEPGAEGVFPHVTVLTPDETIALLRSRQAAMPVVDAFFWASFAGMPDDITRRHVELLSTVVRAGVVRHRLRPAADRVHMTGRLVESGCNVERGLVVVTW